MGSSLHAKPANGSGQDELLVKPDKAGESLLWPQFSPDGKYLVYELASGPTGATIWSMTLDGERKRTLLIQPQTPQARLVYFRLSNDGEWLAYSSTQYSPNEVFVQGFPTARARTQISNQGGSSPHWRRDGKELYYLASDGQLMAVTVKTNAAGLAFDPPQALFPLGGAGFLGFLFDVAPDGQRVLALLPPEGEKETSEPL